MIADEYFADRLAGSDLPALLVESVEENKTASYAERLIGELKRAGARRGSRVIAVGGGIVQDLSTLTASLYMRGLPWTYVPTTLMAMVDSCVGGKSSLNVGSFKNLAGNFYPPSAIAIDPSFIATLTDEDVVGGLSEAVKICFCRGPEALERYLELHERFAADPAEAAPLIHHVLSTKKWFVEVDEFDRAERRLLNFGHTFAHAIEPATGFAVPHGVAVGLGCLCAVALAREATGSDGDPQGRLEQHLRAILDRVPGLRARLDALDRQRFEEAFLSDKKHTHAELRLILPVDGERASEVSLPHGEESLASVRRALEATIASVAA